MKSLFKSVIKVTVTHKRRLAALLLVASVFSMAVGMVRFVDYTLPMLQEDYQTAAQSKSGLLVGQPSDDALSPLEVKPTISDLIAERMAQTNNEFFDWSCGSRERALFNEGWKRYQDYDFEGARSYFDKAYTALGDSNGVIRPADRELASNIQLLIGNCYANRDKTPQAVSAYEMSLTLNPNNIIATYNLERLQDAQKGGGGGKGAGGVGKRV